MSWRSLLGLAVTLVLLLALERWIHRHLQGTMLLLTGDREIAVVLYALPLMPGVLLHEVSHAVAARLLGVRSGRVSIRPKLSGEHIRLGSVAVAETDIIRASLIGLAPLLSGCAVILLIGYTAFGIGAIQQGLAAGHWADVAWGLRSLATNLLEVPDVWLWAYLIFAVSNTMLPSQSDRSSWMPILLFLTLMAALVLLAGLGPAIINRLNHPLDLAVPWIAAMLGFTVVADLPFILLIALLERLLQRLRGVRIEY